jgi:hypothetical protein
MLIIADCNVACFQNLNSSLPASVLGATTGGGGGSSGGVSSGVGGLSLLTGFGQSANSLPQTPRASR